MPKSPLNQLEAVHFFRRLAIFTFRRVWAKITYTALSQWIIDGSYGSAADCDEAHHSDLNALQGLTQNSRDFLQTQAGRCVAADDTRLAK